MVRSERSRAIFVVRLCVRPDGRVDSLTVVKESGLPKWDASTLRAMREWRYSPYQPAEGKLACKNVCAAFNMR